LNQRLLFSALTIDLFVATWPGLLLLLSLAVTIDYFTQSNMWLFLAQISVLLAALGLLLIVIGIWQKGTVDLRRSQFLVALSLFGIFGTLISVGFGVGVARWAAMDCGSFNPSKCLLVRAGGYMELYFIPNLAAAIIILGWAVRNLVSLSDFV
jgi:hypothetical protein